MLLKDDDDCPIINPDDLQEGKALDETTLSIQPFPEINNALDAEAFINGCFPSLKNDYF